MSYRQLLANLEALPEEERQFAAFSYYWWEAGKEVCGCVMGKGVPDLRRLFAAEPALSDFAVTHQRFRGADFIGMSVREAKAAQIENDGYEGGGNIPIRRRARYAHMIEWLRARVAEESEAPQAPKASP